MESAEQKPPDKRNKGVRRLVVRIKSPQGPLTVAVLFAPQWDEGDKIETCPVRPITEWQAGRGAPSGHAEQ